MSPSGLRSIIVDHTVDCAILICCETALYGLLYLIARIPWIAGDASGGFIAECRVVLKWTFVTTLGYLGVDSLAQMVRFRWRHYFTSSPKPAGEME